MPIPPLPLSGGCLCGRIRFDIDRLGEIVACHCGMCRRASGGAWVVWLCTGADSIRWQGKPQLFASSDRARRGFCPTCGSPLLMHYPHNDEVAVPLGALDHPQGIRPSRSIHLDTALPDPLA